MVSITVCKADKILINISEITDVTNVKTYNVLEPKNILDPRNEESGIKFHKTIHVLIVTPKSTLIDLKRMTNKTWANITKDAIMLISYSVIFEKILPNAFVLSIENVDTAVKNAFPFEINVISNATRIPEYVNLKPSDFHLIGLIFEISSSDHNLNSGLTPKCAEANFNVTKCTNIENVTNTRT